MDKLIVTVFANEKDAYKGSKALQELHDEGSIGLYARAVITKHADGGVDLQDADDYGPMGSAVGMLVGSIVGFGRRACRCSRRSLERCNGGLDWRSSTGGY